MFEQAHLIDKCVLFNSNFILELNKKETEELSISKKPILMQTKGSDKSISLLHKNQDALLICSKVPSDHKDDKPVYGEI